MQNPTNKFSLPAWAKLTIISIVAAISLAGTNLATKDIIENRAGGERAEAMKQLLPAATKFETESVENLPLDGLYIATENNSAVGYVGQITTQGYAGPIEVLVALNKDLQLAGIRVGGSDFAETAGLGALVKEEAFTSQYAGKNIPLLLTKPNTAKPDTNEVDQVSGATISSKAVNNSVNYLASQLQQFATGGSINPDIAAVLADMPVAAEMPEESTSTMGEAENPVHVLAKNATAIELQIENSKLQHMFVLKEDDKVVGYIAQATAEGFEDMVETLVAVDTNYAVTGIIVGAHNFHETPGIGSQTQDENFTKRYIGKKAPITMTEEGKANTDANEVDQITGATFSSKAVNKGVNIALNEIPQHINSPEMEVIEKANPLQALVPEADEFIELAVEKPMMSAHIAKKGGETIAYIGQAAAEGFEDDVDSIVVTDLDFKITNLVVGSVKFHDTPNIGSKAQEESFTGKFIGKQAPITMTEEGKAKADANEVDQITGATFTSKAVNEAVNIVLEKLPKLMQ